MSGGFPHGDGTAASAASTIVATSVLPGRVRWRVPGLLGQRAVAERIELGLAHLDGVTQVQASHVTGRILVFFNPKIAFSTMEARAQAFLDALASAGASTSAGRNTSTSTGTSADKKPSAGTGTGTGTGASAKPDMGAGASEGGDAESRRVWGDRPLQLVTAALGGLGVGLALSLGPLGTGALAITAAAGMHVVQKAQKRFRNALRDVEDSHLQGEIAELTRAHRKRFVKAIFYNAISNLMDVARILLIGSAIGATLAALAGVSAGFGWGSPVLVAALSAGSFVALGLRAWFRQRSQIVWHQAVSEIQHSARVRLYEHVQKQETEYFREFQGHQILHALSDDINRFDIFGRAIWDLIDVTVFGTMLLTGAILVGGELVWVALVPIPFIVGISAGLYPRLQVWNQRVRNEQVRLERGLRDGIDGMETIKSFTAEPRESARIEELSSSYRDRRKEAIKVNAQLPIVLEIVFQTATTALYLYSSRMATTHLRIGTFVSLNRFVGTLFFHLANLGPKLEDLERGISSLAHMSRVLGRMPPEDARAPITPLRDVESRDIAYKDIHFAYPGSRSVFDGLSMTFRGGKTTAVVGLTGSGKSTLIKLLLRYYVPQSGVIAIGGVDLAHVPRSQVRRVVSVVDQNIFLFDRTMAENIALHDPDAGHESVAAAATMAQAHHFIERLPHGYDEMLGERGAVLSGGERQRVAIARSLMKDAPIIVFDEATSALDSNTEMDLQGQLLPLFKSRTVIIISHRLSTIRHADHIYLLEDGRCLDEGSHEELLSRPGRYRSLWKAQLGEDE